MLHGDGALSIKHEWRPRGCITLRRQPSGNSDWWYQCVGDSRAILPRQTQTKATLPTARAVGPGLSRSGGSKRYGRYEQHLFKLKRADAKEQIESEIRYFLRNETLTFGADDSVELEKIFFDWPNF